MMNLLNVVKTETIIGIVAIVVIVISVGIIIATAVRNFLLQKKMKIEEQNKNISEIDGDAKHAEGDIIAEESVQATITAEDEQNALQTEEIQKEFGDVAEENEETFQEIDMNDKDCDHNGKMASDDLIDAKIDDNSMDELVNKLNK